MNYITHYLSLINASHPITSQLHLNLSTIQHHYDPIQLDTIALNQLLNCLKQCQRNEDIALISGYRSHQEQINLYNQSLRDNGVEYTTKYVAKPGCSEHESGLAIDIGDVMDTIDFIAPQLRYNQSNNLLRQCLFDHGFIQRYPAHKLDITGIDHEPWHFRYVGYPHSAYMQQYDLILEEYIHQLKQTSIDHPLIYQDYIIYATKIMDKFTLATSEVSESNDGFYIVTTKIHD